MEKRVLNSEATEAAKEKLARIKDAFTAWVWTDPDRTDRLARLYNDRFNNLVPRRFDGRHLTPARCQQHYPVVPVPEAALSGDRTIRRIEDAGSQANQFAMAKAIARVTAV